MECASVGHLLKICTSDVLHDHSEKSSRKKEGQTSFVRAEMRVLHSILVFTESDTKVYKVTLGQFFSGTQKRRIYFNFSQPVREL